MVQKRRKSINAIAKNAASECKEENETLTKIKELKSKINLVERKHLLDVDKLSALIKKNEDAILTYRCRNSNYRSIMCAALKNDKALINRAFANRGKDVLAFGDKSAEEVIVEVDQTVCDLARKMNELVYQRQKKQNEYKDVAKKLEEASTTTGERKVEDLSGLRQVENSLDKIKLKYSTARHIQNIYTKIKSQIENELRAYPKTLGELETSISDQRHEMAHLSRMEKSAHHQMEVTLILKAKMEKTVREDRKKRESVLRSIRQQVRLIKEQDIPHPNTRKMNRHEHENQVAKTKLAEYAKRMEIILDTIKDYKTKAEMLEAVTGIPFTNQKSMVACLENQRNSSEILNKQVKALEKNLQSSRKHLNNLTDLFHEIVFNEEKRIKEKIDDTEHKLLDSSDQTQSAKLALKKKTNLIFEADECLDVVMMYLLRTSGPSHCWESTSPECLSKESNVITKFERATNMFLALYQGIINKINHTDFSYGFDLSSMLIRKKDIKKLLPESNDRIKCHLERRNSEEFGDYNHPNNEEYLSRDMIKSYSEGRHAHRSK